MQPPTTAFPSAVSERRCIGVTMASVTNTWGRACHWHILALSIVTLLVEPGHLSHTRSLTQRYGCTVPAEYDDALVIQGIYARAGGVNAGTHIFNHRDAAKLEACVR